MVGRDREFTRDASSNIRDRSSERCGSMRRCRWYASSLSCSSESASIDTFEQRSELLLVVSIQGTPDYVLVVQKFSGPGGVRGLRVRAAGVSGSLCQGSVGRVTRLVMSGIWTGYAGCSSGRGCGRCQEGFGYGTSCFSEGALGDKALRLVTGLRDCQGVENSTTKLGR